jgi:hypothetical protein
MSLDDQKINLKKELLVFIIAYFEERASNSKQAMINAQNSANNQEKSSAGDKYETSRAMGQIDRDMNAKQYAEALAVLTEIQKLNIHQVYTKVSLGAIVKTSMGNFFISAGAGKVNILAETYFCVSPDAPIAKALQHLISQNSFEFNGKMNRVLEVF